jgi:hypothetical protein
MRYRILTLAAVAVVLTACVDELERPNGRFGSISATAFDNGAGTPVLNLEAAFYGQTDIGFQLPSTDSCFLAQFSEVNTINTGLTYLRAGDFLTVRTGARVDTMTPITGLPVRVYESRRNPGIPFTPGDSTAVDIPGSPTFPAASISVKTAEAFTHSPINVPAADADLVLAWTAAPSPGSIMTVSLRYANAFSSGNKNEQLFCSFVDDGAATIPASFVNGWRTAFGNNRSTSLNRVRQRQLELDSRTTLLFLSTFGQPLDLIDP